MCSRRSPIWTHRAGINGLKSNENYEDPDAIRAREQERIYLV